MTVESPPGAAWTEAEVARNFRTFMIIWAAQLVARLGNGLTAFGLGVYVYRATGSSTSVALVTLAAFLPGVVLAPLGGVLADRFDRRLLMILSDAFSAVGLVALLLLVDRGLGTVPVVCACVAVSSVFTSVMDPAYRATVTDLLTPDQYARAGGLVQFAAASQYLISPAIAGFLMARFGIEVVLLIDVGTLAVTTLCVALVWRTIRTRRQPSERGFWADFGFGVGFLARNRGITVLMLLVTLVTFCMGFLQTLLTPMLLDLSNEETLGIVRSVAAIGMVVSSLAIGIFNMGNRHLTYMAYALAVAGVAVLLLGATPNVLLIGVLAFVFFMTLPPLNTSVEVLVRSSIPNETQGKVWGLVGLISQLGYLVAYAVSGVLADVVFNPLLVPGGALAGSLGSLVGVGPSRGIGLMLMVVGLLLVATAVVVPRVRSIRKLENDLLEQSWESKE
ncbi:MFS transporter [Antribacter gilvus]|uniref:MFS transporter n=1 Tax=Antribacter gilvus TaxID=2304675 RepID=UPI000F784DCD|nr:MFS transporter [Antribacter gilvus]